MDPRYYVKKTVHWQFSKSPKFNPSRGPFQYPLSPKPAFALLGVNAGQAQSSASIPANGAGGFGKFSANSKVDIIQL